MAFKFADHKGKLDEKTQKKNNVWTPPPSGTYAVVNTGIRSCWFTSKKNKEDFHLFEFTSKIIKAIAPGKGVSKEQIENMEGIKFTWSLFDDFESAAGSKRLAALISANACGEHNVDMDAMDNFNPSDIDELMERTCGNPFKIDVLHEEKHWTGKGGASGVRHEYRMITTTEINEETYKKIKSDPDYRKMYTPEVLEENDRRDAHRDSGAVNNDQDDGFFDGGDDDLPF